MKLHQLHDKFTKEAFSNKERAIAFFKAFLPEALLKAVDLEELTVLEESYITKELSAYFSDIVFDIPLANHNDRLHICLLFEHKSAPDPHIQIQVGSYIFNHWMKALKNKKELQPIIPIVYYQGIQKWIIPAITDLFAAYPQSVSGYLPKFEQIFIPIQSLTEEQILKVKDALMISAILSQRFTLNPEQLLSELERIYRLLPENTLERNFVTQIFVYTLHYIKFDKAQIAAIMDNIAKPLQKDFISTYDMIVQEGVEKGAMEKNIDVVLKGFSNGIDIEVLAKLTQLSKEEVTSILKENGVTL